MSEPTEMMMPAPRGNEQIKWGYAMARVSNLPQTWDQASGCVRMDAAPPRANDILVSQVVSIGRHTQVDCCDLSKSMLFVGDLVGLSFAPRYATGQFQAIVPETLDEVHFVCAGGVCGQITGIPAGMKEPTVLRPLGYLTDNDGRRIQLGDHALPSGKPQLDHTQVICVVGSAMDSGKTTAAFSLINGLSRAGLRVGASKITGTASAKDLIRFRDAGAKRVRDFTNAGYASTADLELAALADISDRILCDLMLDRPDVIVLEIADGVTQHETKLLLDYFASNQQIDRMIYTCNDALGVESGVRRLAERGLPVCAVSGMVTRSELSTLEAQHETDLPVLTRDELLDPQIAQTLFPTNKPSGDMVYNRPTNGVLAG